MPYWSTKEKKQTLKKQHLINILMFKGNMLGRDISRYTNKD